VALRHALWLRWHRRRIEMLLLDVRHAMRALARRPGFTIATVLTLAIGIGANTAIYSTLRAVLWRPLPFPEAERLVMLSSVRGDAPDAVAPGSVSPPDFTDWRDQSRSFSELAAFNEGGFALTGGVAEQVPGAFVTGQFFAALRTPAALGRVFQPADAEVGAPDVVLLGHGLWQRRFGADPAVIGRVIEVDSVRRQIVGVMPRGFAYPLEAELWLPLPFTADELATQRGAHYLSVIGRLRNGASLDQARTDLSAVSGRLSEAYPRTNRDGRAAVQDLRRALVGDVRPAMRLLFAAVSLVLLVACVNVANLILGASLGRSRDVAVRAALGASRGRLLRGFLVESAMLAAAGGVVGLGVAALGVRIIAAMDQAGIPLLDQTRLDPAVLLFAAAATAGSAIAFGLLPAWRSSRPDVVTGLRSATGRTTADAHRRRARGVLVIVEVALAVALLVGAGLVGRSLSALASVSLGFRTDEVQTYWLSLPDADYPIERRAVFVDELLSRLRAMPDVQSAATVFGLPLSGWNYYMSASERDGLRLDEADQERLSVQVRVVTPDYFQTLGIPVVAGRAFQADDRRGREPVAIVSASAARAIWPDGEAVGGHFTVGSRMGLGGDRVGGRVVGVVGDVRDHGPASATRPTLYVAYAQFPVDVFAVVARARRDPLALAEPLRAATAEVDPNLPVFRAHSMTQLAENVVAQPRLYLALLALFAAIATALAAVGIYGVMAQNVAARRREIGIRLALGATRPAVVRLVVKGAMGLAVAGVSGGWLLAWFGRRLVSGLLFGVEPADATTYAGVAVLATVLSVAAAWLPARRAASVDPSASLRAE
jgi:putative ABC transport system permease protein